jgi:hypothetical protein
MCCHVFIKKSCYGKKKVLLRHRLILINTPTFSITPYASLLRLLFPIYYIKGENLNNKIYYEI